MTAIVAVQSNGSVAIAADSRICYGEHMHAVLYAKTLPLPNGRIGIAGEAVLSQFWEEWFGQRQRPPVRNQMDAAVMVRSFVEAARERKVLISDRPTCDDSQTASVPGSFLFATTDGIFLVVHDMVALRFPRFAACGSGKDYALGALEATYRQNADPEALARTAVAVASKYDPAVGGETASFKFELAHDRRAPDSGPG